MGDSPTMLTKIVIFAAIFALATIQANADVEKILPENDSFMESSTHAEDERGEDERERESGGLAWAGKDEETAPQRQKAADPKKCDEITKGAKGLFWSAIAGKESYPLLSVACAAKVTCKARRHAMMSVFDWAAACKPWCYPGTAICMHAADVMQAKQQITSIPSYKASGTGGRFPAGPKGDICKMAKMFVCGFAAGANEPLCKDTEEEELIQGSPASIKAAATNAKAQGKAAKAAAQTEAKETKPEAETAKKAKKLAGEQKKLTDAAAKSERHAAEKFAKDSATAADQMMKAAKATAKAAKKAEKFKKEMEAEEAKLKKEGAAAKKVSEKRIAAYKEQMEKMEKAKKKSIALGNKIVKAQGALAEAHKKKLAGIDKEYQIKSKQLAAKKKKDEEKFAAEKAKIGGAYRKAMKKNKKAKDDKIAQLKAEAASNKAKAKAEFKKIAATAKAAAAALAKANAKEKKVKDFHAGVEKARRTKEIKEKKDKEAEANNEYKKEAAEAGVKQTKAKAAEAVAEKSNKLSVEEQKNAGDLAKAADAKDAAMAECAADGSECQEGNKCKKIDNSKGPYMAADGFSCSKVKQSWVGDEDESGGLAWAGIDQEAAPLEPLKAADPKKCAALTTGATGLFKTAITSKTSCPLLTAACATKVTFKERRHAMLSVFDWTAACKPWCYPGTATKTADGVQDTWGICLDAADVMQAKEQITDMPSYKASGTGGRFPAGPKGDICKMAKMFVCGFASGANEPLCK